MRATYYNLYRRLVALFCAMAIAVGTPALAACGQQPPSDNATAADSRMVEVKSEVNSLGVGRKVTVTLVDGSKVKGSISQINDESFVLSLSKKQSSGSELSYTDVSKVEAKKEMSPRTKGVLLGLFVVGTGVTTVALLDHTKVPLEEGITAF